MPTTQQLKDAFNLRMKNVAKEQPELVEGQPEETKLGFWEAFDEFVKESGNRNNWAKSTYQKFSSLRNHLNEFNEDLTFDYFSESGLNEYLYYLRDERNMRNDTISKQLKNLKYFLRWSFLKGYNEIKAFETFKPKLKSTSKKVIFLTWAELNQLRDYTIPESKKHLERIRDVFLFCCFTGLRYSDVRNLKRSDVKSGHIEVTTVTMKL